MFSFFSLLLNSFGETAMYSPNQDLFVSEIVLLRLMEWFSFCEVFLSESFFRYFNLRFGDNGDKW